MNRTRIRLWLSGVLILVLAAAHPVTAQVGAPDDAIRLIASRAVGMPENAFEVSATAALFKVLRVNSTINASSHQGRNNEATSIVLAISAEFARRGPQYANIQAIVVEYVERSGTPMHDSIVDSIEFRKNPDGKFEFHIT